MTAGTAFWILMFLWMIGSGIGYWGPPDRRSWFLASCSFLLFFLFLLIGFKLFGQPLKG